MSDKQIGQIGDRRNTFLSFIFPLERAASRKHTKKNSSIPAFWNMELPIQIRGLGMWNLEFVAIKAWNGNWNIEFPDSKMDLGMELEYQKF